MENFATTYGTLAVAGASLVATFAAFVIGWLGRMASERIAKKSRETSLKIANDALTQATKLREEQSYPRLFVRTGRVDRNENRDEEDETHYHFLSLENRGGTTAEIDSVVAYHPETDQVLGRADYRVVPRIFPGEWTSSGVKIAKADVEKLDRIKVVVAYRMVDLEDQAKEYVTRVSLNNRMSNPMGDRSVLSIMTRDRMEQAMERYFVRENSKEADKQDAR